MTSNHRQSTTFSDEEDINLPTETSARVIIYYFFNVLE